MNLHQDGCCVHAFNVVAFNLGYNTQFVGCPLVVGVVVDITPKSIAVHRYEIANLKLHR